MASCKRGSGGEQSDDWDCVQTLPADSSLRYQCFPRPWLRIPSPPRTFSLSSRRSYPSSLLNLYSELSHAQPTTCEASPHGSLTNVGCPNESITSHLTGSSVDTPTMAERQYYPPHRRPIRNPGSTKISPFNLILNPVDSTSQVAPESSSHSPALVQTLLASHLDPCNGCNLFTLNWSPHASPISTENPK